MNIHKAIRASEREPMVLFFTGPYPNIFIKFACPRCLRRNEARAIRPFGEFDGRMEWALSWSCWCGEMLTITGREMASEFARAAMEAMSVLP